MLNFTKEVLYEFKTTFNFAERNTSLITPDILKLYMVLIKTYFLFLRVPTNEPFDDMDGSINAKNRTLRVVYFTLLVSSISFFIVIPSLWPLLKRVSITIATWDQWYLKFLDSLKFRQNLRKTLFERSVLLKPRPAASSFFWQIPHQTFSSHYYVCLWNGKLIWKVLWTVAFTCTYIFK